MESAKQYLLGIMPLSVSVTKDFLDHHAIILLIPVMESTVTMAVVLVRTLWQYVNVRTVMMVNSVKTKLTAILLDVKMMEIVLKASVNVQTSIKASSAARKVHAMKITLIAT